MRNRKLNRLKDYDYSQNGLYFVTICTKNRINVFGKIEKGEMLLNKYGQIAHEMLDGLGNLYYNVIRDEFKVMPNHVHVIIGLTGDIVGNASAKLLKNKKNIPSHIKNISAKINPKMRSLQRSDVIQDRTKMLLPKIFQIYKSEVT